MRRRPKHRGLTLSMLVRAGMETEVSDLHPVKAYCAQSVRSKPHTVSKRAEPRTHAATTCRARVMRPRRRKRARRVHTSRGALRRRPKHRGLTLLMLVMASMETDWSELHSLKASCAHSGRLTPRAEEAV